MGKPTHMRRRTKTKVTVERFEGGIIVVKNMKGKVLSSYDRESMAKFYSRYKSLVARGDAGRE